MKHAEAIASPAATLHMCVCSSYQVDELFSQFVDGSDLLHLQLVAAGLLYVLEGFVVELPYEALLRGRRILVQRVSAIRGGLRNRVLLQEERVEFSGAQ